MLKNPRGPSWQEQPTGVWSQGNCEAPGECAAAPAREASVGLVLTGLPPAWARMDEWVNLACQL